MTNNKDCGKLVGVLALFGVVAMTLTWCVTPARAVACTPLATYTPTPVVAWDQIADANLAGYSVYYREPGGVFQLLLDFPCEWYDMSDPLDGIADVRFCRGPDMGAPLQRYCPSCLPFNVYEFSVKAYDLAGRRSTLTSNVVSVCFSPLCVRPGPCN